MFSRIAQEFGRTAQGASLAKNFRLSALRKVFLLMGRTEKIAVTLLLIVVLWSAGTLLNAAYVAVTKPAPALGGSYREGMLGEPLHINPLIATTSTDDSIVRLVFSGLLKYDDRGELLPDLAESMPEVSADQKQYTVKLKHDVTWHNSKPFTADDVVFTVRMLQDPAYQSPLRSLWLNTTVEKIDDFTVLFRSKDVSAPFLHSLTLPILPASIWQGVTPDRFLLTGTNLEAVGTGPYAIREIKKLPSGRITNIKLESFSDYYGGKAFIDEVTLVFYDSYEDIVRGLQSKEIDGFGFVSLDKKLAFEADRANTAIHQVPLPQYQAVFFNTKHPIFQDKTVRLALNLATDKQSIVRDVFGDASRILDGPILPEQLGSAPAANAQSPDLQAAAALLDQGGWKIDPKTNVRSKGSTKLEFALSTNDFPLNTQVAEMLVSQWSKLNINVRLNVLPTKELADKQIRPRTFDVLLFAQKLSADPDPFIFWHSSQIHDPGLNLTQFANAEADKLISEARTTTDNAARNEKYAKFQSLVQSEAPAIFLNQTTYVYVTSTKIKNIRLHELYDPSYRFFELPSWYIAEKRVWK